MTEWFRDWFGADYLAHYPHRDDADAARLFALLRTAVPWQAGWRVLDVACGPGRHTRLFREAGMRVTGLDLSMVLLRRAREVTDAPLVCADMRQLPIRPRSMDLVVNLFTSFGYFADDAEHAAALRGMIETLRPGGWFAIDFLNAHRVRAELVAGASGEASARRSLSEDGRFVRKTITGSDGRTYEERVRLFSAKELTAMVTDAGLAVTNVLGDYEGAPHDPAAPRTIVIGSVT